MAFAGRATIVAFAATTLLTAAAPAAVASDSPGSTASCVFDATIALDPGLPYAGPVNFTTVNETPGQIGHAALRCTQGKVNGAPVLADEVGGYRESGWTVGDCAEGSGQGVFEAWIPTTRGVQYVTGTFNLVYDGTPLIQGGLEGVGSEAGPGIQASFTYRPVIGSCTSADPLQTFRLHQEEFLYT
jgi:hypothetical protein